MVSYATIKTGIGSAAFFLFGAFSTSAAAQQPTVTSSQQYLLSVEPEKLPSPLEETVSQSLVPRFLASVEKKERDALSQALDVQKNEGRLHAGYLVAGGEAYAFIFFGDASPSLPIAEAEWLDIPGTASTKEYPRCNHTPSPCVSVSTLNLHELNKYLRSHDILAPEPLLLPTVLEETVRGALVSRALDYSKKEDRPQLSAWLTGLNNEDRLRAGYFVNTEGAFTFLFLNYADSSSLIADAEWVNILKIGKNTKYHRCRSKPSCVPASTLNLPDLNNYLRSGTLAEVIHPFTGKTKISWHAGAVQPLTLEPVPKDAPLSRNHGLLWNNTSMADEQFFFGPDGIYVEFENEVRRLQQGEYEPDPTLLRGGSEHCDMLGRLFVYTPENAGVKRIMELKCAPSEWLAGVGEGVIKKYSGRIRGDNLPTHNATHAGMEKEYGEALPVFTVHDLERLVSAYTGRDEAAEDAIARGLYTGVLVSTLTARNNRDGVPTPLHFKGNERTFPYILYFARILDDVIIEDFKGDYIAAYAAVGSGGRANTITLADITGNSTGVGIAQTGGYAGSLTLVNITGDFAGAVTAMNNGGIETFTLASIAGNYAGADVAWNKGMVGTFALVNIAGNYTGAFRFNEKGGIVGRILALNNIGDYHLKGAQARHTITSLDGLAKADEIQALIDTLGQPNRAPEHYATAAKQLGALLRAETQ